MESDQAGGEGGGDQVAAAAEVQLVEQTMIADVLTRAVPISVVAMTLTLVGLVLTSLDQPTRFVPAIFALACMAIAWRDTRRHHHRRALVWCLVAIGGVTGFGMIANGGIDAPAWKLVYFAIVATAWTFGRRGAAATALLASLLAIVVVGLDELGALPRVAPPRVAFELLVALLTAWLVWFASSTPQQRFRQALASSLLRERELAIEQARRVRAEAERSALEGQLRHSQKMQALGTLAGGIAHDFNNILASVVANLELARGDVGPGHAAIESIEAIERGAARAIDLVRQLLAFSRNDPASRMVTPIGSIVREAARLMAAAIPPSIELRVEIAADVPQVLCDGTALHQVITNLGTNAWHAIEPGAGHVVIRADAVDVDGSSRYPAALAPGRYARISVEDDGQGMSAATIERIFEPFFTTKEFGKGSGLGLAVVHGIVTEHGGAVAVESEPGRGSVFHVYLPAAIES